MNLGAFIFIVYLTCVSFALYFTFRDKKWVLFIINIIGLLATVFLNFLIIISCIIPVYTIISSVAKQIQRKIIERKLKMVMDEFKKINGGDINETKDSV